MKRVYSATCELSMYVYIYIYIYISVYTYVYRCHEILRAGRADAFLVIVQEKAVPSNIHKYKHTLIGVCVHMWHIASK